MKTTLFQDRELPVSVNYDLTYMEYLNANEIPYTSRTLPIFQTLLPLDTLSYAGYEIAYKDEQGTQKYAYPFVTVKKEYTKCITFLPEEKLDNLFLLDLEQALRTGKLVFTGEDDANKFDGFDFTKEIRLEELLSKVVDLSDGSRYTFTAMNEFPEGITGKKILPDGEAVDLFLAKTSAGELFFFLNEANSGFVLMDQETIASVFGKK